MELTRARIVKVVGVTFAAGYPDNLLRLADVAAQAAESGERLNVQLIRRPDNPYDRNAIEIHVPALGAQIGHVDRANAARLAPRMDAGDRFFAQVLWCRIDPEHTDRPGIDIGIARVLDEQVA